VTAVLSVDLRRVIGNFSLAELSPAKMRAFYEGRYQPQIMLPIKCTPSVVGSIPIDATVSRRYITLRWVPELTESGHPTINGRVRVNSREDELAVIDWLREEALKDP
jgi:hypothetical protein